MRRPGPIETFRLMRQYSWFAAFTISTVIMVAGFIAGGFGEERAGYALLAVGFVLGLISVIQLIRQFRQPTKPK
jgi:hypothetical protein